MTLANQAGKLKNVCCSLLYIYYMNLTAMQSSPSEFFYCTLYC
jgi:hypothetical protein